MPPFLSSQKAIVADDLVIGRGGPSLGGGHPIPTAYEDLPNQALRFNGSAIVDARSITSWYVDGAGGKHMFDSGGRQALSCAWDAELAGGPGAWAVRTAATRLMAYASAKRWAVEHAGVPFGQGVIPTDERTQGVLTAAYVKASADQNYEIADWKAAPGVYVTINAAAIMAMADAVEAHVQACFAANRAVDEAIAGGSITSEAEIDAFAWPSNS